MSGDQFAGQGLFDQRPGFGNAIKRHEGAEARPLVLTEQHLIEPGKPVAQVLEGMGLADLVDLVLDVLARRIRG